MRTLFTFNEEGISYKIKELRNFEVWKYDIGYTFRDGDMILYDVFKDDKLEKIIDKYNIDEGNHPTVDCMRFERDDIGVYQRVYLDLDNLEY